MADKVSQFIFEPRLSDGGKSSLASLLLYSVYLLLGDPDVSLAFHK